jgi:cytochrome c oxidase cbb3-type subunit 3
VGHGQTTGHTWDGDLSESNNPLPRWWMWMFYITIIFSLVYLVLYPGLGSYKGSYGWSSTGQFETEQKDAALQYGAIFDKYLQQDLIAVAADPDARAIGGRLFLNYCSQCHGSDAGGGVGPNLNDNVWLYGGDPDSIKTSIRDGRIGMMPAMGAAVGGPDAIKDVANYVRSLSKLQHDPAMAERGKVKFDGICAACHGVEGKGKAELHSANLTDKDWLYGSAEAKIIETITKGRIGQMPAHKEFLDNGKIHLLAAYVYGLSNAPQK